jgi:hypothetical protein
MALRWEDVDLVSGRLVVNRNVSRGRIGSPVTRVRLGGLGSGLAPPMPAVADVAAGTEPCRRHGGVRLMLNRLNSTRVEAPGIEL